MWKLLENLFKKPDIRVLEQENALLRRSVEERESEVAKLAETIERLRNEYAKKSADIGVEVETEAISIKKSVYQSAAPLLINYPRAQKMVEANPELKAKDLMGMLKPLDRLAEALGLERIGEPDEWVSFDETLHQADKDEEEFSDGTRALIKYNGYRMGDVILSKARVIFNTPTAKHQDQLREAQPSLSDRRTRPPEA
jgi:molecular chaperone GrpE (heat shock protein)